MLRVLNEYLIIKNEDSMFLPYMNEKGVISVNLFDKLFYEVKMN